MLRLRVGVAAAPGCAQVWEQAAADGCARPPVATLPSAVTAVVP